MQTMMPPLQTQQEGRVGIGGCGGITIGEAREATAVTTSKKAPERCSIQAAEARATGCTNIILGGIAAAALSACITNNADKTTLADILIDATSMLPANKVATRKDAKGVTCAEMRNNPNLAIHPAGMSMTLTAAARLNQIQN